MRIKNWYKKKDTKILVSLVSGYQIKYQTKNIYKKYLTENTKKCYNDVYPEKGGQIKNKKMKNILFFALDFQDFRGII